MNAVPKELFKVYRVSYQLKEVERQDYLHYFVCALNTRDAEIQFQKILANTDFHVEHLDIVHFCDIHRMTDEALTPFLLRSDVKAKILQLQSDLYEKHKSDLKEQNIRSSSGYSWLKGVING